MGLFDAIASTVNTGLNIWGARQANADQMASTASQMQYARENMFHQNAVNHDEAALAREWMAGQTEQERAWNLARFGEEQAFNASQSQIGRDFNAQQAQINRDFQERMSNTQYQRATADMMAAGISPMLAISQGGAGNVGGATASGDGARASAPQTRAPGAAQGGAGGMASGPGTQHFANVFGGALASGAEMFRTLTQAEQVEAMTETQRAQTLNVIADTQRLISQTGVNSADAARLNNLNRQAEYDWAMGLFQNRLRNETDIKASEANRAQWDRPIAEERWRQERLRTEYLGLERPRHVGQSEFEEMMNDAVRGGSSSASGLKDLLLRGLTGAYRAFGGR